MKINLSLENHAGYKAAKAKEGELRGELSRHRETIRTLEQEIGTAQATKRDRLAVEAEALLRGDSLAAAESLVELRAKLADARHKAQVFQIAVEQQSLEVQALKRDAEAALCREHAPLYRRLVHDAALKQIEAAKADKGIRDFLDSFDRAGASFLGADGLTPMQFTALGDPREGYSAIARHLRDCALRGFITRDEIPSEWLDYWGELLDAEQRAFADMAA